MGANSHFSYFLCHCFDFFHGCFHTKIFIKCKFRTHYNVGSSTILIKSLKFKNNCRIAVSSPSNLLLWKQWIWVFFEYYALLLFLFRSGLARHGLKQSYHKGNRCRSTRTLCKTCASVKILRREKCKVYCNKLQR